MSRRVWQRFHTLPLTSPLSQGRRKVWSPFSSEIRFRLCSSTTPLPVVANCKVSVHQRDVYQSASRLLRPYNLSSGFQQKARYSSSSRDERVKEKPRNMDTTSTQATNADTPLLPKLPVPKVEDTLTKYLAVLSTVLSPHELHVTTQHVTEFMTPGGWGDSLQAYLLKRHSDTDNWAVDWWLDSMYLRSRLPLPIHSNAAVLFPVQHFANTEQYLRFAAKLVRGIMNYKSITDRGALPVDTVNQTQPLCMEQEYRMMASYRRPGIPSDQLLSLLGTHRPSFFIVARKNQFYKVDTEQDGVPLSEEELYSQLCKVMTAAQHHTAGSPPVGILTAMDRSSWAQVRERLAEVGDNRKNLDLIEKSLLLLCLDTARTTSSSSSAAAAASEEETVEEIISRAHYVLHGLGTDFHSCNRWFDKTMQVLLSEDGSLCSHGEHAMGDGASQVIPVRHALTYCDSQAGCEEGEAEQESRCLRDPVWLTWTTTSEIDTYIDRAKDVMDRNARNIDVNMMKFEEFGSEFPKSQGVSPDAFVQLALQFTYYRLYGRMAMSYESACLRRFRSGRMDNVRANSPAALAWIQAMCGEIQATKAQKQVLFLAATEWHKKYQTEANTGYGMDCHLIGLQEAARDLGVLDSIPLFLDPAFQKAFHFPLSTSQISFLYSLSFYGPSTPDGYGVPYILSPDHMIVIVTSFRDCGETDSSTFLNCLKSCLLEMRENCQQKN